MRKILACTLLLSILLGYATATAQSRKERRAKRKAKTEKQASKSTHTPVSVKPEKTVTEKTTVQQTEPYCPELNRNLTPAQIDSLVALWREKQTLQSYDTFFNDYIDIDSLAFSGDTTPDSVYANRLRALVSPVQLPFNPIVKNYIRRYVDTRYGTINRVLSLSRYYFPLIEEELIKADLPVELRACRSSNRLSRPRPPPRWVLSDCGNSCPRQAKVTDWRSIRSSMNVGTRCKRPAPPAVT